LKPYIVFITIVINNKFKLIHKQIPLFLMSLTSKLFSSYLHFKIIKKINLIKKSKFTKFSNYSKINLTKRKIKKFLVKVKIKMSVIHPMNNPVKNFIVEISNKKMQKTY
jgi:hypothetical protein